MMRVGGRTSRQREDVARAGGVGGDRRGRCVERRGVGHRRRARGRPRRPAPGREAASSSRNAAPRAALRQAPASIAACTATPTATTASRSGRHFATASVASRARDAASAGVAEFSESPSRHRVFGLFGQRLGGERRGVETVGRPGDVRRLREARRAAPGAPRRPPAGCGSPRGPLRAARWSRWRTSRAVARARPGGPARGSGACPSMRFPARSADSAASSTATRSRSESIRSARAIRSSASERVACSSLPIASATSSRPSPWAAVADQVRAASTTAPATRSRGREREVQAQEPVLLARPQGQLDDAEVRDAVCGQGGADASGGAHGRAGPRRSPSGTRRPRPLSVPGADDELTGLVRVQGFRERRDAHVALARRGSRRS